MRNCVCWCILCVHNLLNCVGTGYTVFIVRNSNTMRQNNTNLLRERGAQTRNLCYWAWGMGRRSRVCVAWNIENEIRYFFSSFMIRWINNKRKERIVCIPRKPECFVRQHLGALVAQINRFPFRKLPQILNFEVLYNELQVWIAMRWHGMFRQFENENVNLANGAITVNRTRKYPMSHTHSSFRRTASNVVKSLWTSSVESVYFHTSSSSASWSSSSSPKPIAVAYPREWQQIRTNKGM